jgi:hypothetical protein
MAYTYMHTKPPTMQVKGGFVTCCRSEDIPLSVSSQSQKKSLIKDKPNAMRLNLFNSQTNDKVVDDVGLFVLICIIHNYNASHFFSSTPICRPLARSSSQSIQPEIYTSATNAPLSLLVSLPKSHNTGVKYMSTPPILLPAFSDQADSLTEYNPLSNRLSAGRLGCEG